jgi:membrane protease YdiL (CAAX protease family)
MFDNIENTTYKQLIFLGLLILIGMAIFIFGGLIVATGIWSTAEIEAAKNYILDTPGQVNFMKYFQFITMFGTFVFPPLALTLLMKNYNFSFLYLNRGLGAQKTIILFALVLISLPIITMLANWNSTLHLPEFMSETETWMIEKDIQLTGLTERFMLTAGIGGLLINLLVMAVLPAFGEEFVFRGILMKWFSKSMGVHAAIFLSAFLFSAIHIQFLGFFPRFFMGLLLGYVFYWSGSLWASILLHFLNNAMTVVSYYLVGQGILHDDPATMGGIDNTPMLLVNILVFMSVMYWYYRNRVSFKL